MNTSNFQHKMEEILAKQDVNNRKRLLLHVCCAPCSSYCLECLTTYFDIDIDFYNPNIAPQEEFMKRYDELVRFVKHMDYKERVRIYPVTYVSEEFYQAVRGMEQLPERGERCYVCYELRMRHAAKMAKETGCDFFTTSLSISPYKNAAWLNEIGERLAEEYEVSYLYADFKKKNGYKRSIELSELYGLYRQDYCGCIFSKKERENVKNGLVIRKEM